jgi:hypothetical protein
MKVTAKNILSMLESDVESIFPVRVESGQIVAANGQTLLRANRETGTTPLQPVERDALIKFVGKLLIDNQSEFKAFLQKYMKS